MKPFIGLVPMPDMKKNCCQMTEDYLDAVSLSGGIPVTLPLTSDPEALGRLVSGLDGFVLTGGHDVSPELYGEAPLPGSPEHCPRRDAMEAALLRLALAADKPLLGICRGLQFMNAALGGSLWQDLPSQRPSDTVHMAPLPYDRPVHSVRILPDAPLHELLRRDSLEVNSYHHQAIKTLAGELRPMAISEDGLTEAAYLPLRRFVWGVQWHPEALFAADGAQRAIIAAFIAAARA